MQSKTQRKRTPKAPVTPEQVMIDKAVEALVSEGVYTGEEGFRSLIHRISKSYIQATLRGELTAHLNGEKEAASDEAEDDVVKVPNKRNGTSTKRVKTDIGELEIDVPRDRNGTFEPILLPKHARTFGGLDTQIIAMYARGMSTRDISEFIKRQYGISASPEYVSTVTDSILQDILIAVTDGLPGMTSAIETVFPQTEHQTCIVHLIRASTAFISHKDRKAVCAMLKEIYGATDSLTAERALEALEQSELGRRYPVVAQTWRRAWAQVVPFFNFPPEVRRLIYTTNSIEGLNRAIRKVIKTRTLFPNEKAAKKLIYLAIQGFTEEWKRPTQRWASAMPFFAIRYGERFTGATL